MFLPILFLPSTFFCTMSQYTRLLSKTLRLLGGSTNDDQINNMISKCYEIANLQTDQQTINDVKDIELTYIYRNPLIVRYLSFMQLNTDFTRSYLKIKNKHEAINKNMALQFMIHILRHYDNDYEKFKNILQKLGTSLTDKLFFLLLKEIPELESTKP